DHRHEPQRLRRGDHPRAGRDRADGCPPAPEPGEVPDRDRGHGRGGDDRREPPGQPRRGREGAPDHEAVQAGQPRVPRGGLGRRGRRRQGPGRRRRRFPRGLHRRAVRGRERADAPPDRPPRPRRRRDDPPRRGLQAADQPLLVPGARAAGPAVDAPDRRRAGHADLRRGDGHPAGRGHGAAGRHVADRGAEHAELRPPAGGRQDPQAGAAEARAGRDRQGLAAERRVRAEPGEQGRGAVRAGDQDVRGQHPVHDGHQQRAGRPVAEPPADDRRPEPRGRQAGLRRRAGPGRHGGRGARGDRRGPLQPGRGPVRRPAGPAAGRVPGADDPAPPDRGGDEERVRRGRRAGRGL
ncbi:MAG: 2-keto-3-deoxy-D-arabino-heptulosonate-7-phosphate synthase I beta, partial [uncultured Phycisphaerae bacterium]